MARASGSSSGSAARFNVANTLAAATTAGVLGIAPDVIAAGLAAAAVVPGRFERVLPSRGDGGGVVAIVDYAHTPDGLAEVVDVGPGRHRGPGHRRVRRRRRPRPPEAAADGCGRRPPRRRRRRDI